ncbi:hypothetical protein ASE23_06635 [Rhizobium sp. Root73]|uniref:hypothetical protein n=1 Tax=unclassified Rhizobium TaxID=2613769 RepID=UPI0007247445|nr:MULTISPECIES: hypothetical protein [unclassified Rhizobium]KQY10813.1 hypothetical protein ASD36_08870 [Rhizobium sp. Root1334]KRC04797.1 hypothetical protein ASE23_06635 [Rhizobium sp. Root73]
MTEKQEKRRNCADKLRAELMSRKIHRRKRIDPALSIGMQLLALTSLMINLFPAPSDALPLPEPPRPEPIREPNLQAEPSPRSYKHAPSWPLLMRDLGRPVAHRTAKAEVYARLPIECRPWLDAVFRESDWSALRPYARSGASDDEVSKGVLGAFQTWKADQEERTRKAKKDAAGGKAGTASQPGGGEDDDRNDDKGVKP